MGNDLIGQPRDSRGLIGERGMAGCEDVADCELVWADVQIYQVGAESLKRGISIPVSLRGYQQICVRRISNCKYNIKPKIPSLPPWLSHTDLVSARRSSIHSRANQLCRYGLTRSQA
jgi:hypothetical protein